MAVLGGADKLQHEMEGIWNRVPVQRLWIICILFEHAVMLLRFTIISVSPSTPVWIARARENLAFRIAESDELVLQLQQKGCELDEIQRELSTGLFAGDKNPPVK